MRKRTNRLEKPISIILDGAELIIADVGAANGLPTNLQPLAGMAKLLFFEPDGKAAEKLKRDLVASGHANVQVLPVALAGSDGPRTLYVTNVPTGSSLLKPGSEFFNTFGNPDYFYPMREVMVQTRRLDGVLAENNLPRLDALKIDTQGAELEILQGLGQIFSEQTLCVELEIGYPGSYANQPGFGALDAMITQAGFYLFDLKLASADRHRRGDGAYYRREIFHVAQHSPSITKRISESDAVYFRRTDQALARKDAAVVRRLMVMMCTYGFFVDAYVLADEAQNAGVLSGTQAEACRHAITDWHAATCDVLLDSPVFTRFGSFMLRAWRFWQKRFLGRRFYRWQG